MEPAIPLVLTQQEHALIGEMVEIVGQRDEIMIGTVTRLDQTAATKMKSETNVVKFADIWANTIKNRISDTALLKLVDVARDKMKDVADIRNDFIHACFEEDYVEAGYVEPGYQTTSAKRIRTGLKKPVSEIRDARHQAAKASCLVAHIDHCVEGSGRHGPSQWAKKIEPLLQAHSLPVP